MWRQNSCKQNNFLTNHIESLRIDLQIPIKIAQLLVGGKDAELTSNLRQMGSRDLTGPHGTVGRGAKALLRKCCFRASEVSPLALQQDCCI